VYAAHSRDDINGALQLIKDFHRALCGVEGRKYNGTFQPVYAAHSRGQWARIAAWPAR